MVSLKYFFLILLTALLLSLSGCDRSQKEFNTLKTGGSVLAYESFLQKHPGSRYAAKVKLPVKPIPGFEFFGKIRQLIRICESN